MTLREATKTIKALLHPDALVTFEAKSTINGNHETLEVKWYTSTHRHLGYAKAFPSVEAAVANAVEAITETTIDVLDDVVVA